jgi:hypothetical protein
VVDPGTPEMPSAIEQVFIKEPATIGVQKLINTYLLK